MVPNARTALRPDRLRSLNLPQPVRVLFSETAKDPTIPVAVSWDENAPWKRIEAVGEVWQVDDEWWRDPISRRYVDAVLQSGKHLAMYEDLMTNTWFAQHI
jgi:hypothetical protein